MPASKYTLDCEEQKGAVFGKAASRKQADTGEIHWIRKHASMGREQCQEESRNRMCKVGGRGKYDH